MEAYLDNDAAEIQATKSYILSLCSAIGGMEEIKEEDGTITQTYIIGDEALACLKDLKKAIRLDSQNNEKVVLNALVEYNLIETDIVPLILSFRNQKTEIAHRFILACVELLVPMTWPVEKKGTGDEEVDEEEDPNLLNCYRNYKKGLLRPGIFETILSMVMKSVRIPQRDRSLVDKQIIRLALYLFRNLTAIPDLNMPETATYEQYELTHLQENLVIQYYEADVIEFLLTIASNSEKQQDTTDYNLLVLETIYYILKPVDPKDVFLYKFTGDADKEELRTITSRLSNLLGDEARKRQKTSYPPTRHNRFGGAYVINIDGKRKISTKQQAAFADPAELFDASKKENRVGTKRKLGDGIRIQKVYQNRKSLMYLKLTAQSFLIACFNAFYGSILKDMQREDDRITNADYVRYHFTMHWFLEYFGYEQKATEQRKADEFYLPTDSTDSLSNPIQRNDKDFDFALIASAINLKSVLFTLRHMRIKLDEKGWFDVQMAAECFKQMLLVISTMNKSENEEYRDIAEHIQQNLFYEQTAFDLFVEILKCYKAQSYGYLKAVILLTHVLLKMLDSYRQGKKMLFVRRRKNRGKKKSASASGTPGGKNGDDEEVGIVTDIPSEDEAEQVIQEQEEQEYKDAVFQFSTFEQKYINWDVINAYLALLETYETLSPEYFTCIASMFHRIMVKQNVEYLFWKAPVLELFNRILINAAKVPRSDAFDQLKIFIRYAVRQFFKGVEQYPLLIVEAFLLNVKTSRKWWEEEPESQEVQSQQNSDNESNNRSDDDSDNHHTDEEDVVERQQ
ncbi:timeless protein-domain-containing protein [Mycotypha africana]|uniref:timeless protein-domain-containing protein n=1 Tax=Mycotypha africana TaxID=64632 RepID=UPI00230102F1|nr:timeless protein-domain-containing protein [Mycotypha africana]KAI8992116.1 timeless protein-domain-containing protein [Mycotypha africana]